MSVVYQASKTFGESFREIPSNIPPLVDYSPSGLFGLTLNTHVEGNELVLGNLERRAITPLGKLTSVSAVITEREWHEPVIASTCSYKTPSGHVSELCIGEHRRVFEGVRDMCINLKDYRFDISQPETDVEVLAYINEDREVCYRLSSDDFTEEFKFNKVPEGYRLAKIGLNEHFKFQFHLTKR